MQAHSISGVVIDIAAFKVSHCIGKDIDATATTTEMPIYGDGNILGNENMGPPPPPPICRSMTMATY